MISYDMAQGGVTDCSSLIDAPAGKHGFTRIEGQHFVNDAGRIRFNGVNIVGGANFPSHEQAERMARRLAHLGFNKLRQILNQQKVICGTFTAIKLHVS